MNKLRSWTLSITIYSLGGDENFLTNALRLRIGTKQNFSVVCIKYVLKLLRF